VWVATACHTSPRTDDDVGAALAGSGQREGDLAHTCLTLAFENLPVDVLDARHGLRPGDILKRA
jgi:hypothetical protein